MNENHTTSLSDMEIYDGENVSTYGVYEKIIVMMLSAITFFLPWNSYGVGYRDVNGTSSKALVVTMKENQFHVA